MVDTPSASIGALHPLGYAIQSAFGTPNMTIDQWIDWTSNTLEFTTGLHTLKTAYGSRATEQESALGENKTEGGFDANLRTSTIRGILEAFFGGVTAPVAPATAETLSVGQPKYLTFYDSLAGEGHYYQDVLLNQLTLQSQSHAEWGLALTALGGIETLGPTVTPAVPGTDRTLAWADVSSLSGLGVAGAKVSQFQAVLNNGVILDWGAGSHAPTLIAAGEWTVSGTFQVRFDGSDASSVRASYKSGADLGPATLAIDGGGGNTHTIYLPKVVLTKATPMKPLADLERLSCSYSVKQAQDVTWALPAAA